MTQKHCVALNFFICITFSSVQIFICMTFSSVWDFHLYEVFVCIRFSSVWGFHLYEVFICMRFYLYEVFIYMRFFILAEYANGVCLRSIFKAFFWWNDHFTNVLLQCDASLHHCITSSYVFFLPQYSGSLFPRPAPPDRR